MNKLTKRVLRGGSWYFLERYLRSAPRCGNEPGIRNRSIGLRVCSFPKPDSYYVVRGGSWISVAWDCRSAFRSHRDSSTRSKFASFRVLSTSTNQEPNQKS